MEGARGETLIVHLIEDFKECMKNLNNLLDYVIVQKQESKNTKCNYCAPKSQTLLNTLLNFYL